MGENILTVGAQSLVLLLLILVGYVCGKVKLITPAALSALSNLTLYVVIPCTLISAFQLELTADTLRDFFIGLAAAICIHLFNFLVAWLVIRDRDDDRKRILTLSTTFTNCNFMGFPLQSALLGPIGIFYGSPFAAASPLVFWTLGVSYLEGNAKAFNWKKMLLNPGIFGVVIGLVLFLGQITLPTLLNATVDHLANLAVPVPMLVIGCQMAQADLRHALRDRWGWVAAGLRLLALPLAELGILYALGIRGNVLIATTIAAAASPAAMVSMMAQRFEKAPEVAAEMVSLQTLLAIVTMPVVVGAAQLLA